jgi:hypothetical protein
VTGYGVEHVATFVEQPDGTFTGGCDVCGVKWYGETERGWADAWCTGHNSAVHRIASFPVPLWFPPTGPGDAVSLDDLRALVEQVIAAVGDDKEIVFPAAQPPLLFVWTPPSEEGWHRERLGAMFLQSGGAWAAEPHSDARG